MGLSPGKMSDDRPDLFIDAAVRQGELDQRVFSMNFVGDYELSYITLGGYDVEQFAKEELTWHDNMSEYYWSVKLDSIRVDGPDHHEEILRQNNRKDMIVDSGSSYILLPEGKYWNFMDILGSITDVGTDEWSNVYCYIGPPENLELMPDLIFTIDGKDYRVPRESLYTPHFEDPEWYVVEVMYLSGWNEYLVGLTFLQNYYAVYDMDT